MSTVSNTPGKKDWLTNFSFYLLTGGLVVSFILIIIFVLASYWG